MNTAKILTVGTPVRLCDTNPSRTILAIFNSPVTAGYTAKVNDDLQFCNDAGPKNMFNIPDGGWLILRASEGWDVTKPWYGQGYEGTTYVNIVEEFLPPAVMTMLHQKGIESTHGLALLLLAGVFA